MNKVKCEKKRYVVDTDYGRFYCYAKDKISALGCIARRIWGYSYDGYEHYNWEVKEV